MACFLVPAGEAVLLTVAKRWMGRDRVERLHLNWLNTMLWGGTAVLAVEHLWHGEVVPWPPFLTAVSDGAVGPMLHEMATIGGSMAAVVTATWLVMHLVANAMESKQTAAKGAGA